MLRKSPFSTSKLQTHPHTTFSNAKIDRDSSLFFFKQRKGYIDFNILQLALPQKANIQNVAKTFIKPSFCFFRSKFQQSKRQSQPDKKGKNNIKYHVLINQNYISTLTEARMNSLLSQILNPLHFLLTFKVPLPPLERNVRTNII